MDGNFPQNRQYGRNIPNNRQQFPRTRQSGMSEQQFPRTRQSGMIDPVSLNPPYLAAEERFLYSEHRFSQGRNSGPSPHVYHQRDFGSDPSPMHERPAGARAPQQGGLDGGRGGGRRNAPFSHPSSITKPNHQTFSPDHSYQYRGPESHIPPYQRGNDEDVDRMGFHPREDAFQREGLGEEGISRQRADNVYSRNKDSYGSEGWAGNQTGRGPINMTGRNNPGQINPHGIQKNRRSNLQHTEKAGGNKIQLPNAPPSKNKRYRKCILNECENSVSNLKEHMLKCHLPKIFNLNFLLNKPALHDLRMQALRELTFSILGSTASLEDLCRFLRNQNILPQNAPINGKTEESMRAFCHHHGYIEPRVFTLHTINSPAVLLHWRAVSTLLRFIPPVQQNEFYSLFQEEGLEFELDLMNNKRQQDQGAEQRNQANIPPQSSSTKDKRFLFDVQMNLNRIRTQHSDSQQDAEFGKSKLNDKQSLLRDIKREQQVQNFEEPSFHREDLPEKILDQQVGLPSPHPLDGGTKKEDPHKKGKLGGKTAGLSRSQMRRRRRLQALKRKHQRKKKVQKRIMKNREARKVDKEIKKLNVRVGCPVPGCYKSTNLKHHAYKVHLPKIFDLDLPISDSDLHSMRWQTLRELTMYILGADAQVEDLLQFMRSKNIMPQESTITHSLEVSMKALCQHQGLKIPRQFTIWPPNSPAILLHWRALLGLLQYVTPRFQQQFKSAFAKATIDGLSLEKVSNLVKNGMYLSKDKMVKSHQSSFEREEDSMKGNVIKDRGPTNFGDDFCNEDVEDDSFPDDRSRDYLSPHLQYDEQYHKQTAHFNFDRQKMVVLDRPSNETFSPKRPALMDSHFYFDRLCFLLDVSETPPSDLLSNLAVQAQPRVPVDIIGGAIVYSNPESFSSDVFPNYPRWRNCFGVDALIAPRMQEQEFRAIGVLTNSVNAALGDIGLDRSAHKDLWMGQEVKFKQLLGLSTPAQPMILKITGPYGDPYGFDVSSRVRELVRRQCGPTQHIHLCNFKGDELMVKEWLDDFSNCYFGFSRKVLGFDEQQIKGLQAVPDDRLLLESDISLPGVQQNIIENSPLFLGEVASAVASIRNDSLENIARKTVSNTCRLYNL